MNHLLNIAIIYKKINYINLQLNYVKNRSNKQSKFITYYVATFYYCCFWGYLCLLYLYGRYTICISYLVLHNELPQP